jgi:hypothetical protein
MNRNDPRRRSRENAALRLRRGGATYREIGARLGGVTGSRARTMVLEAELYERETAKITRWRAAAVAAYDCWFVAARHRPLDMGGPRDVWIDYDPWDTAAGPNGLPTGAAGSGLWGGASQGRLPRQIKSRSARLGLGAPGG